MEKLISDSSKFAKIDFNPKHKVNQDIRHLLDMEFEIKSCLDDLTTTIIYRKMIINF